MAIVARNIISSTNYFPHIVVSAPESISLDILLRGHTSSALCARSLVMQVSAISSKCPNCVTEISECRNDLSNAMTERFSDRPLTMPSARMGYGVILFASPQPQIALAACLESEKLTLGSILASRLKCYPVGVKRPILDVEVEILEQESADWTKSSVTALWSILALFVLLVVLLDMLRIFAAQEPTDKPSLESGFTPAATLKISNVLKRMLDIFLAILLLFALLPIFLVVAAMIRILEGAPIFYMSRRFITPDKSVTIFKFRTMVKDAASPKYQLEERFMRDGYLDIPLDCEAYTPIGRLLERSQLVETLQLLNILFDGMSFVGNRPLPRKNIELLKQFGGWYERFNSPAGITGISQITGKYVLLPQQRLNLERMYASLYRNPKGNIFLCDVYIIGYTVMLLLTRRYILYNKAVAILIRCGADKESPAIPAS